MEKTANKFKAGEMVYSKEDPSTPLVIRRYLERIYYCRVKDNPNHKEMVFFERELLDRDKVQEES